MDGDYDNNRRVYRSAPTPKNSNRWPRLKRKGCQWDAEAHEGEVWTDGGGGEIWECGGQATDIEKEKKSTTHWRRQEDKEGHSSAAF